MSEEYHTIQSWLPILKWEKLPNFGHCHTISDYDIFKENYLVAPQIKQFIENLFMTLTGRFEQNNVRILGRPGCGKTSFVYYLKKFAEVAQNTILEDYVFYIFHVNKAYDYSNVDLIRTYVLEAWRKYYAVCGLEDSFLKIEKENKSLKEKLNLLTDYFKNNKSRFSKILIFVLDDTDLMDGNELLDIIRQIIRNLEVNSVKKWLMVREITYDGYNGETKSFIDGFFPDRKDFPYVPFYEIARHRIVNSSRQGNAKNPYSKPLCNAVLERLFNGNLRESFSMLKNILEIVPPGEFTQKTDESVIQNYLNKSSINAFFELHILPNIHLPRYRSIELPLPLDILLLAKHIKSIDLLFGAVNSVTETRSSKARLTHSKSVIKVRSDDFTFSLTKLIDLGLINKKGKYVDLTSKGYLLTDYAARKHYMTLCEKLSMENINERYWVLARQGVNHSAIAMDLIIWDTH